MTTQLEDDLDRDIALMIEDTEREIFEDATGGTGWNLGNEELDELSQTDAWDGGTLSDAEQFERAINGDLPSGFDRPIELAEERSAKTEVEELRAQLAAQQQQFVELLGSNPEVQARLQQQQVQRREALWDVVVDDAKIDQHLAYIDQLQQQNQTHQMNRINASMASAHREHGVDFENAYRAVTAMDQKSAIARGIVNDIINAPDPGEAMMALAGSDVVQSLGRGRGVNPPFMPQNSTPRGRAPMSYRDIESTDSGYGNEAVEDAIFKAAIG
jgi:hypothetical protein